MSWPKVCFHLWLTNFFIRLPLFCILSQRSVRDLGESVIKASKWIKNRLERECTRYNSKLSVHGLSASGAVDRESVELLLGPILSPLAEQGIIMVQEAEVKSIQARSIDSPFSAHLTRTLANTQAPGEHTATSGIGQQSQSTTDKIPDRNAAISVGVIDEHSFTRECITKSLQDLSDLLEIISFATCDECLQSKKKYDLILYHAHESVANRNGDKERLASVRQVLPIAPVIILCDVDCLDSITAAFESGARGYIPTASTTLELAIEIMRLVRAGGTFVPASSLSLGGVLRQGESAGASAGGTFVPPSSTRQGETAGTIATHQFSPRQMAVLERLKEGKTNKMIAHELGMSESTVKAHLRSIMKKMKATNRTEAACLALTPWRRQEG
jgi:DNA-binding NarL/FixJ family response regulator